MKTDLAPTMNEYLNLCCGIPKHVNPPATNARHVPITTHEDVDVRAEVHGCRCDRWGHPCPDCVGEPHVQPGTTREFFFGKQVR
jgi:hypothetical protein